MTDEDKRIQWCRKYIASFSDLRDRSMAARKAYDESYARYAKDVKKEAVNVRMVD